MCFGGKSTQQANTTSTNQTTVRDIGFTGAQAVNVLNTLFRTSADVQKAGFTFSSGTVDNSLLAVERVSQDTTQTLANVINATRDFSQRAISASSGQSTPLAKVDSASAGGDNIGKIALLVAIAGTAIVLVKK